MFKKSVGSTWLLEAVRRGPAPVQSGPAWGTTPTQVQHGQRPVSAKPSVLPLQHAHIQARPCSAVQRLAQPLKAVVRRLSTHGAVCHGGRLPPKPLGAAHSRARRRAPFIAGDAARSRAKLFTAACGRLQPPTAKARRRPNSLHVVPEALTLSLHQLNSVCSRARPFEAAQRRAQPRNAAQLRSNACPAGAQTNCRWRLRVPAVDVRSRTRRGQPRNTARSRSTPLRAP